MRIFAAPEAHATCTRGARADPPSVKAESMMVSGRGLACAVVALGSLAGALTPLEGQRLSLEARVFNEQVLRPAQQPVIPLYEGWYRNADGTFDICFGYHNLNTEEPVDIPLGERNFLAPAEHDGLQPTHFAPVPGMTPTSQFTSRFRRFYCAFSVTVPSDFGTQREIRWTLQREGGEAVSVPGSLNPAYRLDEPASDGRGELAPILRIAEGGASTQGRGGMTGPERTVRVGEALELDIHVEHPFEERVWVGWVQYKGPGTATFGPAELRVPLEGGRGTGTTTVRFDEPGLYELLVQSINTTAAFEFHCCWTNAYVPVTVTE